LTQFTAKEGKGEKTISNDSYLKKEIATDRKREAEGPSRRKHSASPRGFPSNSRLRRATHSSQGRPSAPIRGTAGRESPSIEKQKDEGKEGPERGEKNDSNDRRNGNYAKGERMSTKSYGKSNDQRQK